MIKASIGKLQIDFDRVKLAKENGFALLDFSTKDELLLKDMPYHHKDSFDRMLIAQSFAKDYPIMIEERGYESCGCEFLVAG